jgi:integral membrane sensor domain MASE1
MINALTDAIFIAVASYGLACFLSGAFAGALLMWLTGARHDDGVDDWIEQHRNYHYRHEGQLPE